MAPRKLAVKLDAISMLKYTVIMGKKMEKIRKDFLSRANKMAALYALGNSYKDIADKLSADGKKISRQRVFQILKKRKILLEKGRVKTATPVAAL